MSQIVIRIAGEASSGLLEAVLRLVPQLSARAPTLILEKLKAIVDSPATHLFLASDCDHVIGMLTLVVVQIPSGLRALIEDVVVLDSYRSQGIGTALNRAAIELAGDLKARTIELTSRPSRIEAIRIYERLGFKRRDTGVFSLTIDTGTGS